MQVSGPMAAPTLPHGITNLIPPSSHGYCILGQQILHRLRVWVVRWKPILIWHTVVNTKSQNLIYGGCSRQ
jgi:hypothetical protein